MTKPSMPKHPGRGLANPTVTARKSTAPTATKTPAAQKTYNTHIPEPHWQRLVSLIIVAVIIVFELYFWIFRHHN